MAHECGSCSCSCAGAQGAQASQGCADRLDDARRQEEIGAAPYLIFAGVIVVLASLLVKWLLLS
jgi:hypothetical protein